ncbi:cell division protein ZapE [Nitratireductor sp. XY-223]|uniref:cell division protein ZapE n=1 Tax=Nitratireductor sp. XY-223 TaxID=2561926 RepID=UPI0010A9D179|nr:cell division protein ZapE [Nitratireductor sp. XY-223]
MSIADRITVSERYGALVDSGEIESDVAQESLAKALDRVLSEIGERRLTSKSSHLGWLFARRHKKLPPIRGLYIHGAVGRGKTMLMDLFYELIVAQRKRRVHFHDFMADVHERIYAHRQALKRGETKQEDPIPPVASQLIAEAWVLCFDEFSVTDIADAMILSRLFEQLFQRGCVLVATSNVEPDDLYHNGLNRQLFLPFIDLLKSRVDVFNLDARTDYRLEKLKQLPVYLTPINDATKIEMAKAWREMTVGHIAHPHTISVKGREIEVPLEAGGIARFTFDELCARPLAASDYHIIAHRYHTVFLENVPIMDEDRRNEAKRFINLVDMLYDAGTRLIVSAAAAPEDLYVGKRGAESFEFARTASRLFEMQSADYLAASRAVTDVAESA